MEQIGCIAKPVFTKEQLAEQKLFKTDLQNGNAKIAFEGTFDEGIKYLKATGQFVDACINP